MARRVIWLLVVIVVLAGGAVIADSVLRGQTEERIGEQTAAAFGLDSAPDVEIVGVTFLPQLAGGTLRDVRLTAPEASFDGVLVHDVDVALTDVDVAEPHTAREVLFTGTVPLDSVPQPDLDLRLDDGQVLVEAELLGLPLLVRSTPVADGRAVVVRLDSIEVGGLEVGAEELPAPIAAALEQLRIEIDALPEGMVLDHVAALDGGFRVAASGTDVALLP